MTFVDFITALHTTVVKNESQSCWQLSVYMKRYEFAGHANSCCLRHPAAVKYRAPSKSLWLNARTNVNHGRWSHGGVAPVLQGVEVGSAFSSGAILSLKLELERKDSP